MAAQQKIFEDKLTLQEPKVVSENREGEKAAEEELKDLDEEDSELESGEMGAKDGGNKEDNTRFFYEDKEEETWEDEDMGIGARVAARRQGRLHNGGGQME